MERFSLPSGSGDHDGIHHRGENLPRIPPIPRILAQKPSQYYSFSLKGSGLRAGNVSADFAEWCSHPYPSVGHIRVSGCCFGFLVFSPYPWGDMYHYNSPTLFKSDQSIWSIRFKLLSIIPSLPPHPLSGSGGIITIPLLYSNRIKEFDRFGLSCYPDQNSLSDKCL